MGLRLGCGAKILKTDLYDGTDGHWRPAGESLSGGKIRRGCETIWVRPNTEVPVSSKELLDCVVKHNFRLTEKHGRWQIIPTLSAIDDGRIDWPAEVQDVQPLIDLGFVAPITNHPEVYGVTMVGENFSKTH